MYDAKLRRDAVARIRAGASLRSVSLSMGISPATLREWLVNGVDPKQRRADCPRCNDELPTPEHAYVYLLGLYLGDGCISEAARTTALRIACADSRPGLMAACEEAVAKVSGRRVYRVGSLGCQHITALWKHWPCLFPQHGRGRKHDRSIVLADWQREMVGRDPRPLIRGLIHSDGCRAINWTERHVGGTTKRYTYPRYFFSNVSADIRNIFTDALDLLEIAWTANNWNSISVARREAVAALDEFVGPKY
jgi:hypothetical protein